MKAVLLFALVALFVTCPATLARPGDLDSSFGVNGVVRENFNGIYLNPRIKECIIRKDGKILIAANVDISGSFGTKILLMRYTRNGYIDSTFGINGTQIISYDIAEDAYIYSAVSQKDDKILLSGELHSTFPYYHKYFLLRLKEDGDIDSSFNNDGIILSDKHYYHVFGIEQNGDITRIGQRKKDTTFYYRFEKYLDKGMLDSAFGKSGGVDFYAGNEFYFGNYLILKNKILLTGSFKKPNNTYSIKIFCFNEVGSIDSTFGQNGNVDIDLNSQFSGIGGIFQNLNGKLICYGYYGNESNESTFLLSLFENGLVDSTFGINGIQYVKVQENDNISKLIKLKNGDFFISGNSHVMDIEFLYIRKYKINGDIDSSFSINGTFMKLIGSSTIVGLSDKDPDGYIILVGEFFDEEEYGFALIKLKTEINTVIIDRQYQNYYPTIFPNPTHSNLTFRFSISQPEFMSLSLYNIMGIKITTLIHNKYFDIGNYEEIIDINGFPMGMYYLLLQNGDERQLIKVIIE